MKSFRLEKQDKKSVGGLVLTTAVIGIFFHGAWIATLIGGIIWLYMHFTKKDQI